MVRPGWYARSEHKIRLIRRRTANHPWHAWRAREKESTRGCRPLVIGNCLERPTNPGWKQDGESVLYGLQTFGTQYSMHTLRNGLQIRTIQPTIGKEVPEYGVRTHHAMLIKGKCTDGSRNRGKFGAIADCPRYAATIPLCPSSIPPVPTIGLPCSPIATKVDGRDSLRLKQRFEDD